MNPEERRTLSTDVRIALLEQDIQRVIRDQESFNKSHDTAVSSLRVAMIVSFVAVGVALLIIGVGLLIAIFGNQPATLPIP